MKRIHIVDDHEMFAEGLLKVITDNNSFDSVGYSLSGERFLEQRKSLSFDILLLDIHLPGVSGFDICQILKKEDSTIKIIVISMANSPSLIHKLKKIGVDGFLTKNASIVDILNCIDKVMNNESSFPKMAKQELKKIRLSNNQLTKREMEVIKLIAEGKNNQEIAQALFISVLTVETHRKNINQKLGTKNAAEVINYFYFNES